MELRWACPCNALIVGGSMAGKTVFTKRLVENRELMFQERFSEVIWYYSEWQDMYEELAQKQGVKFVEGLPSIEHFPPNEGHKLVVCDDFMDKLASNQTQFLSLAIKGAHHRSLSLILLLQGLFPPKLRGISLQAQYICLFKAVRDLAQVRTFCLQIQPAHYRALMEAYEDATKQGHSYLLFDFHQKQQDHLRYRTHIFPGESTVVYIPKALYKSDMSHSQGLSRA